MRKLAIFGLLLALSAGALGMFKAQHPPRAQYQSASLVLVAQVSSLDKDKLVLQGKVTKVLKGDSPGETLTITFKAVPEAADFAAAGNELVLMQTGDDATVHMGDTWLGATADKDAKIYRLAQVRKDLHAEYPGSTPLLIKMLETIKAGKATLLEELPNKIYPEGPKETGGNLGEPTSLAAADIDGDGKAEVIACYGQGVKVFSSDLKAELSSVLGLEKAAGTQVCVGDVNGDGAPDLVIDRTLYVNVKGKFVATPCLDKLALKAGQTPLTMALADFDGDGKNDLGIVTAEGGLIVLLNNGTVDKPWETRADKKLWDSDAALAALIGPWGADGKPAVMAVLKNGVARYELSGAKADFFRLCGSNARAAVPVLAAAVDYDMNGTLDLLVLGESKAYGLSGRGLGCYLYMPAAGAMFVKDDKYEPPFKPSDVRIMCPLPRKGKGGDMLFVLKNGKAFIAVSVEEKN